LTDDCAEKAQSPDGPQTDFYGSVVNGFVLRVGKHSKVWMLVYNSNGIKRRERVGNFPRMKVKEARREADDLLKRVQQGDDPHAIKVEADEAPTFAALAARYLTEYSNPATSAIHGNKGKRTWSQDQNKLDAVLLPAWDKLKARAAHVIKLLKDIVAEGKPAWANRVHALISSIFNFAINDEAQIVASNPAAKLRRRGVELKKGRALTEQELRRVWITAEQQHELFGDIVKAALLTGQRRREITGMRWSEINGGWWTIPGELAKNGLAHRVALGPQMLALLERRRNAGYFVFPETSSDGFYAAA
jgi:integrase